MGSLRRSNESGKPTPPWACIRPRQQVAEGA
jgi:hypothetical protein